MAKIYAESNWMIKVLNAEHPPVHVHVVHPDGIAVIFLDGSILNTLPKIPLSVLKTATAWVIAHEAEIRAEWQRLNNPTDRGSK